MPTIHGLVIAGLVLALVIALGGWLFSAFWSSSKDEEIERLRGTANEWERSYRAENQRHGEAVRWNEERERAYEAARAVRGRGDSARAEPIEVHRRSDRRWC